MKAYGFVDQGVPKVKMYWGKQVALIMTLQQFASHMKTGSPLSPEVNRLLKKFLAESRITHVIQGGKQRRDENGLVQ